MWCAEGNSIFIWKCSVELALSLVKEAIVTKFATCTNGMAMADALDLLEKSLIHRLRGERCAVIY